MLGKPQNRTPFFGVDLHLDGLWTARRNPAPDEIDDLGNPFDRRKHFGEDDEYVADGAGTLLWQDPAKRLSCGSFSCFIGVALNDQLEEGRGQLNLLTGAHDSMASFYRRQRATGGVVGPEGEGWPRFQPVGEAQDSVGITFMPPEVRAEFASKVRIFIMLRIGTPLFFFCVLGGSFMKNAENGQPGAVESAGMPWPKREFTSNLPLLLVVFSSHFKQPAVACDCDCWASS